jgi:hypothetical protein
MRKLAFACVLLLCAIALLAGSSLAGSAAADDGCLVVTAGRGIVTTNAKGFVFGRFDQGQVDIEDPVSGDGYVRVFGYQKKRLLTDTKTRYIGFDMRFRASGLFRIRVEAVGIELSLGGKGSATVSSDGFLDPGQYSVDSTSFCESRFQPMPDVTRKLVIAEPTTG